MNSNDIKDLKIALLEEQIKAMQKTIELLDKSSEVLLSIIKEMSGTK